MPRRPRIAIPGVPVHIVQRGNYRQDVFFSDSDRICYLSLLTTHAAAEGLDILGWCLMTNHTHLIAIPQTSQSMARAVGRTHGEYAQMMHQLHGRKGHLWQARFYSAPLSEAYLWTALRYVELNPVRASMVQRAQDWQWSSASAHLNQAPKPPVLSLDRWQQNHTAETWSERLKLGVEDPEVALIRKLTKTERPIGERCTGR